MGKIVMDQLELSPGNRLPYRHVTPSKPGGNTYLFVNALTGNADHWRPNITSILEAQGHGTLIFNFRGQADSLFDPDVALDEHLIIGDLRALVAHVAPERLLPVGLSVGGLFAAKAIAEGMEAVGLVLINALRKPGTKHDWINQGLATAARLGGAQLVADLYLPLMLNEGALDAAYRSAFQENYAPLATDSGVFNLLENARHCDWNFDWSQLTLPVQVITGVQDQVFYDKDSIDSLTALLPQVQRVDIEDAGHMIPVERSGKLADALLRFATDLNDA